MVLGGRNRCCGRQRWNCFHCRSTRDCETVLHVGVPVKVRHFMQFNSNKKWKVGRLGCAMAILFVISCAKESESLVTAKVTTERVEPQLRQLSLLVGGTERTFTLGAGISIGPQGLRRGVYVGSNVTGEILVVAKAPGAGGCEFSGKGKAGITKAGDSVEISIALLPGTGCMNRPLEGNVDAGGPRDGGTFIAPDAANVSGDSATTMPPGVGPDAPLKIDILSTRDVAAILDSTVDLPMIQDSAAPPKPDAPPVVAMMGFQCRSYSTYDATGCDPDKDINDFPPRGVAFSADGTLVATAAWQGYTRLWSVSASGLTATGRDLKSARLGWVQFAAGDKKIYGEGNTDGTLRVFDLTTDAEVDALTVKLEGIETITGIVPMSNPDQFFAGVWATTTGRIWSLAQHKIIPTIILPSVDAVSVAQSTGASQWALIRERDNTGKQNFRLMDIELPSPTVTATIVGPDYANMILRQDATMAAMGGYGSLQIFGLSNKQMPVMRATNLATIGAGDSVTPLRFSSSIDNPFLAVEVVQGGFSELRVYDVNSGRSVGRQRFKYGAFNLAISPDDSALVVSELHCGLIWHCRMKWGTVGG